MDNLNNTMLTIHLALMRREGNFVSARNPLAALKPSLLDRVNTYLGEAMIRLGYRQKEHSYHNSASEQISDPTFMIML